MRHVPPHRFAEPTLSERDREHADACAECGRARARVQAARAAMARLGDAPPPPLAWDLLGAQLYWSASSELRRRARDASGSLPRVSRLGRRALALGLGTAVAGAAVLLVLLRPRTADAPAPVAAAPPPAPGIATTPAPAPEPWPLESAVTFLQGEVRVGDDRVTAQTSLRAGDVLRAARGRVGVQFGDRSGLVLEPESTLELLTWDSSSVVLRVAGAVSVELEARAPEQRFAVLAGARSVEVRGTVFRVAEHAGDLDVAVRRGRVAVVEGDDSVEVAAGARLALSRSARLGAILPEPMLSEAADALSDSMRVPLVAGWSGADGLRAATAMVSVTAPPRARVRVDGMEVGSGSFQLRAAPGRHLVESGPGARWLEVEPGGAVAASVGPAAARSERPGQLDAQLRVHRSDVGHCSESERKAAPGFSGQLEVEIGVNADGSVGFVSAVGRSPYPEIEECVMNLLRDRFTFPPGTQATVRKVINFDRAQNLVIVIVDVIVIDNVIVAALVNGNDNVEVIDAFLRHQPTVIVCVQVGRWVTFQTARHMGYTFPASGGVEALIGWSVESAPTRPRFTVANVTSQVPSRSSRMPTCSPASAWDRTTCPMPAMEIWPVRFTRRTSSYAGYSST